MSKKLYMSINSTSLAHYISKGLILPSRFYNNRPNDVQNFSGDYLLLSNIKFVNDSNCSIEIELNDHELETACSAYNKNIVLYNKPIAISRIKSIYFFDQIQCAKTIDNINRGAGFVPQSWIKLIDTKQNIINVDLNKIVTNEYKYSDELEYKIRTYNQVLGGIAFSRFTTDGKYSENYFSILSHFNQYIKKEFEEQFNKKVFTKYDGAFTGNGEVWGILYPLLYEDITEDDVEKYAKNENIEISKSLGGVYKFEEINDKSITYKLAILSTYGADSKKRKSIDDLISDLKKEKIPKDKEEGTSLIFGINNGYSSFYNVYGQKIVKFKMDSLLDYYTIESIFNYSINDIKDNDQFNYLSFVDNKNNEIINYEYKQYTILGTTIQSGDKSIIGTLKEYLHQDIMNKIFDFISSIIDGKKKEINNLENKLRIECDFYEAELKEKNNQIKLLQKEIQDLNEYYQKQNIDSKDMSLEAIHENNSPDSEENVEQIEIVSDIKTSIESENTVVVENITSEILQKSKTPPKGKGKKKTSDKPTLGLE